MRKPAAGPSQRQLRVAEEIRHVLAGLFERRDFLLKRPQIRRRRALPGPTLLQRVDPVLQGRQIRRGGRTGGQRGKLRP